MAAYAGLIASGFRDRGCSVVEATAPVLFGRLFPRRTSLAKWLGYADQFLLFPPILWVRLHRLPSSTLIVFVDQALGPWMGVVGRRSHIVHVHDLLSLEGSLGLLNEHKLGRSGRLYQKWIYHGFRRARCFLSVSNATRLALEKYLDPPPLLSKVVYNPLPPRFQPVLHSICESCVLSALPSLAGRRFLFHIGRNWYKNRLGVLVIWQSVARIMPDMDLVLVGGLDPLMVQWLNERPDLISRLHVLERADDELIVSLYNLSSGLLFPSHQEGFGWPILEALACGCPVFTTDRPPMTEVGGEFATYLPPCPPQADRFDLWVQEAASCVVAGLTLQQKSAQIRREGGIAWSKTFAINRWLDQLEQHYHEALKLQTNI